MTTRISANRVGPIACIAALLLSTAFAAVFVGDYTISSPSRIDEEIKVVGTLTLAEPGTYELKNVSVTGELRFGAAGVYTVNASNVLIGGDIRGPELGTAEATLSYLTMACYGRTGSGIKKLTLSDRRDSSGAISVFLPVFTVEENLHPPTAPTGGAPLINLATRATLTPGGFVTAGFVVGGTAIRRVLIRAVGPGLAKFGVPNPLLDPVLNVFDGSTDVFDRPRSIAGSDDWATVGKTSAMFSAVGAFALEPFSRDSAVVVSLRPGGYTAQVRGSTPTDSGEVLVEVYFID